MINKIDDIQVLILSGGKGTRLSSIVSNLPKSMANIDGRPFLEYLINGVRKKGYHNICLLTGYMSEVIQEYFGDGKEFGVDIIYSHEEEPLGTGGAIKQAVERSNFSHFLALNGDTYCNIDYDQLSNSSRDSVVAMALVHLDNTSRYGRVNVSSLGYVESFSEKDGQNTSGNINAGAYYFTRNILNYIDRPPSSIEHDIFPKLISKQLIRGIVFKENFIDIGVPTDFFAAQKLIPLWEY